MVGKADRKPLGRIDVRSWRTAGGATRLLDAYDVVRSVVMDPVVGVALIILLGALTLLNGSKKRRGSTRPPGRGPTRGSRTRGSSRQQRGSTTLPRSTAHRAYPGDFTGTVRPEYSASLDGKAGKHKGKYHSRLKISMEILGMGLLS